MDFLAANSFLVDVAAGQLRGPDGMVVAASSTDTPNARLFHVLHHADKDISSLLCDFPSILGTSFSNISPKHGFMHEIKTTGPPVFSKARRLDPGKLSAARQEFDKMEAAGIVSRSDSQWSSPLHMVPKKDGSWRPCGDFRRLNLQTIPDRYPIPNLQDFASSLHGCRVFQNSTSLKGIFKCPWHQQIS